MSNARNNPQLPIRCAETAQTKIYSAISLLTCMARTGRASSEEDAYESLGTVCQAAEGVRALLDDIYCDIDHAIEFMQEQANATA